MWPTPTEIDTFTTASNCRIRWLAVRPLGGMAMGRGFMIRKLGVWHSMDPLAIKYYDVSSYVYCLNNPIIHINPDGKVVVFAPGTSDQFKRDYMTANRTITTHNSGNFIKILENSKTVYMISESKDRYSSFDSKNNTVT